MLRVIWILFGSQQPIVLLFKTPQAYVGEGWFAGPRRTTVVHRRFFVQFFSHKAGVGVLFLSHIPSLEPESSYASSARRSMQDATRASEHGREPASGRGDASAAPSERGERRRGQAGAAALKAGRRGDEVRDGRTDRGRGDVSCIAVTATPYRPDPGLCFHSKGTVGISIGW